MSSSALAEDAQTFRRRAVLHTRADTWQTAAVMTCLMPPIGLVCGVVALMGLRGIGAKIDRGADADAERALRTGRRWILAGTALGALFALVQATEFVLFGLELSSLKP